MVFDGAFRGDFETHPRVILGWLLPQTYLEAAGVTSDAQGMWRLKTKFISKNNGNPMGSSLDPCLEVQRFAMQMLVHRQSGSGSG